MTGEATRTVSLAANRAGAPDDVPPRHLTINETPVAGGNHQ